MDELGYYSASEEIACRELKGEYLIFSGFSRKTLVVHACAFRLIELLKRQPYKYDEILDALGKASDALDNNDLASFVSASLEQFIELGILNYSGE
jgi:hypothetical protein